MKSRWRIAAGLGALVAGGTIAVANCAALGGRATGARLECVKRSPEWDGSHFEYPPPLKNDAWGSVVTMFHTVTAAQDRIGC